MIGYVYLIGTPTFKWYKIGKSCIPEIRIHDLGILLPFKIEIIGIWKAENHSLLEATLHEMNASKRINGEWFRFTGIEVTSFFNFLPKSARIFPLENNPDSVFAKFSNIEKDYCPEGKKIHVSVRKEKKQFLTDNERKQCMMVDKQKHILTKEERKRQKKKIVEQARMRMHLENIVKVDQMQQQSQSPSTDQ